ncbi:uracil-xanthine permease family protein [Sessilibacter corallicola]|uniref:Nucleobase:cation symporter-2 family protein n=1 Tax=Sessilibacter corallicola TaxID=2904075 RepID=A0ABQ0A827_9GAMM
MKTDSDILFHLEEKPPVAQSITAAVQHVLASFVGIITPTLVIGSTLGLQEEIPYLLSMALIVSGISTFIQVKGIGPVGSRLIAVQGTSFAFLGSLITVGFTVKNRGGSNEEIIAMLNGICFFGAFIEIILSQFIHKLRRIITPLVTGIVIVTIGVSLIKVGMTDIAGGYGADNFGAPSFLAIGFFVLLIIIALNASSNNWLRLSSILIGMLVGSATGYYFGIFEFQGIASASTYVIPIPFKYGFAFDWQLFLPIAFIYLLTAIETSGDLTANSLFCGLPIKGKSYIERIRNGVLADGVNSLIASVFCTFPNTTFGQNNAVIRLTGIASRYVGFFVAAIILLLGFIPFIGNVLQQIPKPVLGGATLVMFATVAVAGVNILANIEFDRKKSLIIATSLGLGLGCMMVPNVLAKTPSIIQILFSSPVAIAGITAIVMQLIFSDEKTFSGEKTETEVLSNDIAVNSEK